MATSHSLECTQIKRYRLSNYALLSNCKQIRNISPFLIRPSLRTGAPSPRGKVLCGTRPYKHQFHGHPGKNDNHNFQNHPRRGYRILYLISRILYLGSLRLRRRATPPKGQCHQLKEPGSDFPVIANQSAFLVWQSVPLAASRFRTCYQGENGLPRRCAPRNDRGRRYLGA